jgi:MFS family permease
MGSKKNLVLVAMVFAVGMTFIDQTIVAIAIAIPRIQRELSLSETGSQWVINGYLLALSALFALGGKLADTRGRHHGRRHGRDICGRGSARPARPRRDGQRGSPSGASLERRAEHPGSVTRSER